MSLPQRATRRYTGAMIRRPAPLRHRYFRHTVVLLLAGLSPISRSATAQSQGRGCTKCEITLSQILTLRAQDSSQHFLDIAQVAKDARGFFYVSPVNNRREVHVFDGAGRAVRTIGGPTDRSPLRSIYHYAIGQNDSLLIGEPDGKVHVYDPSGAYVRTMNLGFLAHSIRALPSGGYVAQGTLATQAAAGYPLHIVDASGRVIRSFGSRQAALLPDDFTSSLRWISVAHDGTIWSALPNRYLIEQWDTNGRRVSSIERRVDWFEPWLGDMRDFAYERPKPYQGTPMISNDIVWTVVGVADTAWRQERTTPRREGDRSPRLTQKDRDRLLDTVIEAIDMNTGAMVASLRLPDGMIGFLGDNLLYKRREVADGEIVLEIYRVALTSLR